MIIAFVVVEKSLSIKDIEKFCVSNLESYKIPSKFEFVENLPRTNSGKIKRNVLKNMIINKRIING